MKLTELLLAEAPFRVGDRVSPEQLLTWECAGPSATADTGEGSIRHFSKGGWTVGVRAPEDPRAPAQVVSIRPTAEEREHWPETRMRLMRHKQGR